MKNTLFLSVLLALTLAGIYGCRDNSADILPIYTPLQPQQALADIRTAAQKFTIPAGTATTITGAQGTRLQFGPGSFTLAGVPVTAGTIEIQLIELYRFGDMMSQGATTVMYNGALLTTGGQIYVSATSNGQALASGGYDIAFRQPAADTNTMQLFIGNRASTDSLVRWSDNFSAWSGGTTDTANNSYYQFYNVMHFGWINCDRFSNTPGPKTNVKALISGNDLNETNTIVWLVLPDINAMTALNEYSSSARSFQFSTVYQVPVGMRYYMILTGNNNGTWYYDRQDGLVTAGMQVGLTPAATTKADILDKMSKQ